MDITITINTDNDNAAFGNDPANEVASILHKLAQQINAEGPFLLERPILDLNGNTVGTMAVTVKDREL